jgi:hypothetical protein
LSLDEKKRFKLNTVSKTASSTNKNKEDFIFVCKRKYGNKANVRVSSDQGIEYFPRLDFRYSTYIIIFQY